MLRAQRESLLWRVKWNVLIAWQDFGVVQTEQDLVSHAQQENGMMRLGATLKLHANIAGRGTTQQLRLHHQMKLATVVLLEKQAQLSELRVLRFARSVLLGLRQQQVPLIVFCATLVNINKRLELHFV